MSEHNNPPIRAKIIQFVDSYGTRNQGFAALSKLTDGHIPPGMFRKVYYWEYGPYGPTIGTIAKMEKAFNAGV